MSQNYLIVSFIGIEGHFSPIKDGEIDNLQFRVY